MASPTRAPIPDPHPGSNKVADTSNPLNLYDRTVNLVQPDQTVMYAEANSRITMGMIIAFCSGTLGYFVYGGVGAFLGILVGALGRAVSLQFARSSSKHCGCKSLG